MSEITQAQYDELMNRVKGLETELSKFKVKKEWYETQDTLTLKSLGGNEEWVEIESNYETWEETKEDKLLEEVLIIDVYENFGNTSAMTVISLEQMKQLRDYLNHKIKYLEGENHISKRVHSVDMNSDGIYFYDKDGNEIFNLNDI